MTRKRWSTEDLNKLIELYPKASWEEVRKAFPDVTEVAITHKANKLKMQREVPRWLTANKLNISDFDLGFLIGFVEGEGSFGIYRLERGNYQPHIYICNTELALIEKIQGSLPEFGNIYSEQQKNWKKQYRFKIRHVDQIRQFLALTEPYLISGGRKKKIAQLILELIDLKIKGHWKKTVDSSRQEQIYQEVHALNKRGNDTS